MLNRTLLVDFDNGVGLKGTAEIALAINPPPFFVARIIGIQRIVLTSGMELTAEEFIGQLDIPTQKSVQSEWVDAAQNYLTEHMNEFEIDTSRN